MARVGFPDVVTYVDEAGTEFACPPSDGRGYRLNIKDHKRFEEMSRSGALHSREHTGRTGKCQDNRTTS